MASKNRHFLWFAGSCTVLLKTVATITLFSTFISPAFSSNSSDLMPSEDKPAQWYQIELYIFATDTEEASRSEVWKDRNDLDISYPSPLFTLLDPTTLDHHDYATEALLKLPSKQLTLLSVRRKLSRNRHYRLLYEAAWRQPLESKEASTPILIQGGTQFDDYFELEGTVTLSVSRYLHIHTDLWLSQFTQTLNLDEDYDSSSTTNGSATDGSTIDVSTADKESGELESKEDAKPRLKPESITEPTENMSQDNITDNPDLTGSSNKLNLASSLRAITSKFEPVRTVQLKQSRRMRSKELHYLDHPLFGIVVKVIPYERPEKIEDKNDPDQPFSWEQNPLGMTIK
ncbi:MAG: peptidoglycan binding protein CsiV [Pseudomonadales bacterium]|nr:peptidoglycan binding protein CsiV [Pseudomonadales bacterium]